MGSTVSMCRPGKTGMTGKICTTGKIGGAGRATIFLDRDGTLNEEVHYLHRTEDLRFLPTVIEALRLWNQAGFRVVVVTNQAGVARGYYSEEDVRKLHEYMNRLLAAEGAHIDRFYYCPHHPEYGVGCYKKQCRCRKPDTGMFEQAEQDEAVDKEHSYMIGDKWIDIESGFRFGLTTALVGTGYGKEMFDEYQNKDKVQGRTEEAKEGLGYFGNTLLDVARWILDREQAASGMKQAVSCRGQAVFDRE